MPQTPILVAPLNRGLRGHSGYGGQDGSHEKTHYEMCQVSMKLFGKPLDQLVAGFKPTGHPVAVKRIADLQKAGYVYIKP